MFGEIVVATDGSFGSQTALAYAAQIARRTGARVTALHVVDVSALEEPLILELYERVGVAFGPAEQERVASILDRKADLILEMAVQQLEAQGVKAEPRRVTGQAVEVIPEVARQADLLVMAEHGKHPIYGIQGSLTERVVRRSTTPVLVTPPFERRIERAVVAYDGSPGGWQALELAATAATLLGLALDVVTVQNTEAEAAGLLSDALEWLWGMATPVPVRGFWRQGRPAEAILKFALEVQGDLICLGAFSQASEHKLILGRTATAVLRMGALPILFACGPHAPA